VLSARLVHSLGTLRDQASKVHELALASNKKATTEVARFFPFRDRVEPQRTKYTRNLSIYIYLCAQELLRVHIST